MVEACGAGVAGRTESGSAAGNHSRDRGRATDATRSRSLLRPESPLWARGSNNCGRIHRQAGQGHYPGGSRRRWAARGLWQRSRVRLCASGIRAGQGSGRQSCGAGAGRPSGRPHPARAISTIWARNSSAGKLPPRWPARSSESIAFNQPDVEASKIATRNLTTEYEKTGSLPAEKPVLEDSGIKLFTDAKNADALAKAAGSDKSLAGYLRAHLKRVECRRLLCPARLHRDE